MKQKKIILFLSCLISQISYFSHAQNSKQKEITMEQTLEYLNKKLGKDFTIELEIDHIENHRSPMIISFYKNGAVYKIDKVYLEVLDFNKVVFSEEEKMLILYCKSAEELGGKLKKLKDGCVDREILDKKTRGKYGRINLDVGMDKKKIASLKKAFTHLIKLDQDEEYSSSVPFE